MFRFCCYSCLNRLFRDSALFFSSCTSPIWDIPQGTRPSNFLANLYIRAIAALCSLMLPLQKAGNSIASSDYTLRIACTSICVPARLRYFFVRNRTPKIPIHAAGPLVPVLLLLRLFHAVYTCSNRPLFKVNLAARASPGGFNLAYVSIGLTIKSPPLCNAGPANPGLCRFPACGKEQSQTFFTSA